LLRALKSALTATSASIRLTKKDNIPLLSLTIVSSSLSSTPYNSVAEAGNSFAHEYGNNDRSSSTDFGTARERETIITQDVPVRVLSQHVVEGIHEPQCREPDVHIQLPPLVQIKSISDRFTKLALAARSSQIGLGGIGPKLEMKANMHGCLKLSIKTDAMNISSMWSGLNNPELDPTQIEGGAEGIQQHPSTRMKALGSTDGLSDEGWARVRIDGCDWGRVLSVGRLGGRVIACECDCSVGYHNPDNVIGFCHDHALILYVYLPNERDGEESVLTVRSACRYPHCI
jgi:HUS1 checkpoint protein